MSTIQTKVRDIRTGDVLRPTNRTVVNIQPAGNRKHSVLLRDSRGLHRSEWGSDTVVTVAREANS